MPPHLHLSSEMGQWANEQDSFEIHVHRWRVCNEHLHPPARALEYGISINFPLLSELFMRSYELWKTVKLSSRFAHRLHFTLNTSYTWRKQVNVTTSQQNATVNAYGENTDTGPYLSSCTFFVNPSWENLDGKKIASQERMCKFIYKEAH